MSLLLVVLASLWVSLIIYVIGDLLFLKLKLVDDPVKYGFDRKPVSYSMGVLGVLSFCILSLFFLDVTWQVGSILIAVSVLGLVCFLDDIYKLPPWFRLFVQILAALLVVLGGTRILSVTNPLTFVPIELGYFGVIVGVLWIVSLTNLMNFLDGVSGLSSGVSAVGFLIILFLSIIPGMHETDQTLVQVMSISLFLIAFWSFVFEFPRPKFLIGDSGTMFFGFMLGVLSMINGGKLATAGLVLLIPLFDGAWVVLRRVWSKKSPFAGDTDHLHHRLERIGFSKESILFLYIGLSFIFGLIAVFVWNTFFKIVSLLLLLAALTVTGFLVWTKEKK